MAVTDENLEAARQARESFWRGRIRSQTSPNLQIGRAVMLLEGTIKNGTIVLDHPPSLPDGERVEVEIKPLAPAKPTLAGLLKFAGVLSDLPADFAAEHDHYIHGTPKRNEKAS